MMTRKSAAPIRSHRVAADRAFLVTVAWPRLLRNIMLSTVVTVILLTVYCACLAGVPQLNITKSNDNVILTWSQTNEDWRLVETDGLDHCYVSNGVTYCEAYRQKIISSQFYSTNGNTIFVVLPIDYSITNRFYMLRTNDLSPPP